MGSFWHKEIQYRVDEPGVNKVDVTNINSSCHCAVLMSPTVHPGLFHTKNKIRKESLLRGTP